MKIAAGNAGFAHKYGQNPIGRERFRLLPPSVFSRRFIGGAAKAPKPGDNVEINKFIFFYFFLVKLYKFQRNGILELPCMKIYDIMNNSGGRNVFIYKVLPF